MSERLLLVCADNAVARAVRGALESAASLLQIHNLTGDEAQAGEKFQPSGILIDSDARSGVHTAFERIASAKRQFPAIPIIALGNEMSAQLVLAAMRAGADDFVDRDAAPDELQAVLRSALAGSAGVANHGAGQTRIAAILSGIPSEQDQDFALNLAVQAAQRAPESMTLYIDLSQPATQAGIGLGLDLKFGVSDAIREVARLDRAFLESAVARCPRSGLYLMALSGTEPEALDPPSFAGLLQVLRTICDVIVIGYGPFSRKAALPDGAQIFVCCNQRFSSIRAAGEVLREIGGSANAPQLVIHLLAPGATPAPTDIAKVLEVTDSIVMDASWNDLASHFNDAAPLALGGSARYRRALDSCLARMGVSVRQPSMGMKALLAKWLHLAGVS